MPCLQRRSPVQVALPELPCESSLAAQRAVAESADPWDVRDRHAVRHRVAKGIDLEPDAEKI